jgi:hypothetical protein
LRFIENSQSDIDLKPIVIQTAEEWESQLTTDIRKERAVFWAELQKLQQKYNKRPTKDIIEALMMTSGIFEYAAFLLDADLDSAKVPNHIREHCFSSVDDSKLSKGYRSLDTKSKSAISERLLFLGLEY